MKRKASVVALTMVLQFLAMSCVVWSQSDHRLERGEKPPDIRAELQARNFDRAIALAKSRLNEHVGDAAPDLVLIDKKGAVVRTRSMLGKRIAVLAAISSCPISVAWMKEFKEARWRPPDGFDELVVLIASGKPREWNTLVRACPKAYLVGWPLTGYFSNLSWEPAMLAIGRDGRFEGYWSHGEEAVGPLAVRAQPKSVVNTPVRAARWYWRLTT